MYIGIENGLVKNIKKDIITILAKIIFMSLTISFCVILFINLFIYLDIRFLSKYYMEARER